MMAIRIATMAAMASATLLAVPSAAQDSARAATTPTVDGYLCAFAGKCDGSIVAPEASRAAPRTKGFRLARPAGAPAPAAPVTTEPRPARYHTVQPSRAARSFMPGAPTTAAAANLASQRTLQAAAVGTRANLMIGFQLNSAELTPEGLASAKVFARALMAPELRAQRFLIEGHTDLRGGRALNAALSARRAGAVADYLASQGVDRSRLQVRGFGASEPLPGRTVADPANRRVEAVLIR